MSVNTYLGSLASKLVLSTNEKSSIVSSIGTLRNRLNSHFGASITEQFQFGSSTRGTILPRKADSNSDIDYMVIFDTSDNEYNPQTYLNQLRRFADARYKTSEISQSNPTIVLSLNHIKFELVPAIDRLFFSGYKIPSESSSWSDWISTDPNGNNQDLQDMNRSNRNNIKPLVRLIKYWNAQNAHPLTSYALEQHILSKSFLFCRTLKDYFYKFWSGFGCDYDAAQYIKVKVESAKQHARNAKHYEANGMSVKAESEIKKIVPAL